MQEIKPYKTVNGLKKAIDNGGRFYNWFSQAEDNHVTSGELAKAAGVFFIGTHAFLFLELAQRLLSPQDREAIEWMLDPALRSQYRKQRPQTLKASQVESKGKCGESTIVTGHARFVENKTEFGGFIMIPFRRVR